MNVLWISCLLPFFGFVTVVQRWRVTDSEKGQTALCVRTCARPSGPRALRGKLTPIRTLQYGPGVSVRPASALFACSPSASSHSPETCTYVNATLPIVCMRIPLGEQVTRPDRPAGFGIDSRPLVLHKQLGEEWIDELMVKVWLKSIEIPARASLIWTRQGWLHNMEKNWGHLWTSKHFTHNN